MLDNNAATSIIFPDWKTDSPWFDINESNAVCPDTTTKNYNEDGNYFRGYPCRQKLCIGSWEYQEDVHTTVCNSDQYFIYASTRVWMDWTYYYTKWGSVNSICGLGKEYPSMRSESFVSYAVATGQISDTIYSFEIDPHF